MMDDMASIRAKVSGLEARLGTQEQLVRDLSDRLARAETSINFGEKLQSKVDRLVDHLRDGISQLRAGQATNTAKLAGIISFVSMVVSAVVASLVTYIFR